MSAIETSVVESTPATKIQVSKPEDVAAEGLYITKTTVPKPERVIARGDELTELFKSGKETFEDDIEDDCIAHFFGAGGIEAYSVAAAFAYEKKLSKVIDIGCACAHQAELFELLGLSYCGIESAPVKEHMFTEEYIAERYPCKIDTDDNTLGISRLCVGYLIYSEETYDALYQDFSHLLISGPAETHIELYRRYGNITRIPVETGEYWCYYTKK